MAAALDDCQIPPYYAGNVVINFRTYPIRVSSKKYTHPDTEQIIGEDEINKLYASGREPNIFYGNSGACYPDQWEISWPEVTINSGSTTPIREITTLTKLERRVFTFSKQNLNDAIKDNLTHGNVFISLNFANYIDVAVSGVSGDATVITPKLQKWLDYNFTLDKHDRPVSLKFLGTGPETDQMIVLK